MLVSVRVVNGTIHNTRYVGTFPQNLETNEKRVRGHFRTSVHAVFSYMMIYVHKTYWAPDTPNQWSPRIAKTDHSYPSFCCSVVAPQVNSLNKVKLFCWNYACCYCVIDVFFYCLLLWERWWHHTQHTPFPQKNRQNRGACWVQWKSKEADTQDDLCQGTKEKEAVRFVVSAVDVTFG